MSYVETTLTALQPSLRRPHLLNLIGNTPLIRLTKIGRDVPHVEIYAKIERFNPGGSVKDRAALQIVEDAEAEGLLTPEKILIDATSGNTGIAYAMIGAAKGFRVELVMPANVSAERKKLVETYGAKIIYSSSLESSDGAIRLARKLVAEKPDLYFYADQYNNPSNWKAHNLTTACEIIEQTEGRLTHFVAGIGTGGTIMGARCRLKRFNPNIQIIAVEPDSSLHGLEGLKHMASSIVPGIYHEEFLDGKVPVSSEAAYAMCKRLARQEGLLVGHSSGAALLGALEIARRVKEGVIVTIFPDGGDKYLSLNY
ncbi:MAG: cysteine synthase family protein [Candidatus Tectomicrobia bacterium]|nr:cysteine synthase family protein [Candidatus Tectomicrobia bacterium]